MIINCSSVLSAYRFVDEMQEFISHLEDILANRANSKTSSKPLTGEWPIICA
jgi:hypothetical protein